MSLWAQCIQHWFKSNLHGRNTSCSNFLLTGSVWRNRRALFCCFGERSLPEGQGEVAPSSIHILIWLQKVANCPCPLSSHLGSPFSARLSPHGVLVTTRHWTVLAPRPVPSPSHTNHQHSLLFRMLKRSELQQPVTAVRFLWQPGHIILSCVCWFTEERVEVAKLNITYTHSEAPGVSVWATWRQLPSCFQGAALETKLPEHPL